MKKNLLVSTHLRKKRFGLLPDNYTSKPTLKMRYCGQFIRRFPYPCTLNLLTDYLTVSSIVLF